MTILVPYLLLFLYTLQLVSVASFGSGVELGGFGVWVGGSTGGSGLAPTTDPDLSSSYTALQAWKSSITEDPNGILTTWVGPNVCSYRGVFCSDPPEYFTTSSQVVAVIDLNRASLKGTLVDELSLLTHLSALHLNSNKFSGAVPTSFNNLQYLTELDLSNNLFTGSFPSPTLSIPNLAYLDLRFNRFSGPVPDELFEKDMDAIFLNNNMFDGQIPDKLWNSPASVVNFANNGFTGDLLATSTDVVDSGLREVLFLNNKLTGCIPEEVGLLTNMEVLDFSSNSLTGHLPTSISCLSDIQVFNVAHNDIGGVLSDMVCSLRSLVNLTISFNFFSGLSNDCTAKPLLGFDFSGNCIPGKELQRPPPECEAAPGSGQASCYRTKLTGSFSCSNPTGSITATIGSSLPLPQINVTLP